MASRVIAADRTHRSARQTGSSTSVGIGRDRALPRRATPSATAGAVAAAATARAASAAAVLVLVVVAVVPGITPMAEIDWRMARLVVVMITERLISDGSRGISSGLLILRL